MDKYSRKTKPTRLFDIFTVCQNDFVDFSYVFRSHYLFLLASVFVWLGLKSANTSLSFVSKEQSPNNNHQVKRNSFESILFKITKVALLTCELRNRFSGNFEGIVREFVLCRKSQEFLVAPPM